MKEKNCIPTTSIAKKVKEDGKSPFMISMSFVGWKERDFKWNEENDRK